MEPNVSVAVLGAGYTGEAVLRAAARLGLTATAIVRREERARELRERGYSATAMTDFGDGLAGALPPRAHVIVTFPPDGVVDQRAAKACSDAGVGRITVVSSTGVYGSQSGVIDDRTPVTARPSPAATLRLAAEDVWRSLGAVVLRAPAIYGKDRGLHLRVIRGEHKIPGDGSGFISRLHVDDLAALLLAGPRAKPGDTFVVGDAEPAPHRQVIDWICAHYSAPRPPEVPLDSVHESLRGDRRVDGSRALRELGVVLRYPSYRDGMQSASAVDE